MTGANLSAMAFDGVRFAHALIAARRQLGRSTRDIAKRADVSQPYVVALERAARGVDGPTPTIDVLVRLAAALDLSADVCRERGLSVDEAGFHAAMAKQQAAGRAAGKFKMEKALEYAGAGNAFVG